jgi:hypothetical protein
MSIDDQAADIRNRMRNDFVKTLRQHYGTEAYVAGPLIQDLLSDAMHHVEHLLVCCAEAEQRGVLDAVDE